MKISQFPTGTPSGDDFFVYETKTTGIFRKATLDLLLGNATGSTGWNTVTSDTTLQPNSKTIINANVNVTLTLPATVGEIEIYRVGTGNTLVNSVRYNSQTLNTARIVFSSGYARLVYVNSTIGYVPIVGSVASTGFGDPLLYIAGTLLDQSSFGRTITQLGTAPALVTGLDSKPALRFNATNQELSITPFLSGQTGATVYVVYSPASVGQDNYNIIKTNNIGDYWRFWVDGNGYIGTFLGGRIDGFPASMPASGNHVISIHGTSGFYQVTQNNVSKGTRSNSFVAGDRFRICTNEMPYRGDISLILVYPFHAVGSDLNIAIMTKIKEDYPSLPYTI